METKRFSYLILNFIWICYLCYNYSLCAASQEKVPSSNVKLDNWEMVESGWPIEDYMDQINGKKSLFYFIKDVSKDYKWSIINSSFLSTIEDQSKFFKISFKYWSHYIKAKSQSLVTVNDDTVEYLDYIYDLQFKGEWMPCEYILSYQELSKLAIENYVRERTIIAYKDFKIEYETQEQKIADTVYQKIKQSDGFTDIDGLQLNGWKQYRTPPRIESGETEDFLYFAESCNEGCVLKIGPINEIFKNAVLSFKYWIIGTDTEIVVSDKEPMKESESKWEYIEDIVNLTNYNEFNITVTTKANEISFAAIRDLKIKIVFEDDRNEILECETEENCKWETNESYFWSKQNVKIVENTDYFYPVSKENSLTISRSDNITEINVCFSIDYWVSEDKEIKINVDYNIEKEVDRDTILTIRPKINEFETTIFCLRDLIALNAKNYSIHFTVEQHDYKDKVNGFVLSYNVSDDAEEWNFSEETQTFLQKMENNEENKWVEEWVESVDLTFGENSVHFSATTESKIPASAHLFSKWVKYDPKLHLIDPQYRITVTNLETLYSFKVRPKVCDWLSHCTDVKINFAKSEASLSKTYSFKFNEFKNSKYIKLLFYVEYFQPPQKSEKFEVNFDLELLHFGDPCFKPLDCKNGGECVSNSKTSTPNEPFCNCKPNSTGELCADINHCVTPSGEEACRDPEKCENLGETYRCLCDDNDNIIWNGTECVPIDKPKLENWSLKETNYYPNSSDNSIKYSFSNINTTKFDVCIDLEYMSNQIVDLAVNYMFQSIDNQLFTVSLIKTDGGQENLIFCVRDFRNKVHEQFDLSLKIIGIDENEWNETTFRLTNFLPSVEPIPIPSEISFINRWDKWDDSTEENPAFNQNWRAIPQQLFNKNDSNRTIPFVYTFKTSLSSETTSKALLISQWIKNDSNFFYSENFFSLNYTKGSFDKNFNLTQKVIYYEDEELKSITYLYREIKPEDSDVNFTVTRNNKIFIPESLDQPFKIIFEITYSSSQNSNLTELQISFEELSLGDPCFKYENKSNVCENSGHCKGMGPNNYRCDCNEEFGGINCELSNLCNEEYVGSITNEEYCASLPSLPNSVEKKCKVLNENTYKCECHKNDYYWSSQDKRCVRNGYRKHEDECVGNDCELFDTMLNDTRLSNKNLPAINGLNDPILPFYYSGVNDAKLKLEISDLDDGYDACFKFNYRSSENSSLEIGYNDLGPISLSPIQFNGDNNWLPPVDRNGEELCARSLAKDINQNFNITFNAKINNNENEIISLRFNDLKGSDFVEFRKRDENLLSELPYLIHWSQRNESDDNYSKENLWPIRLPSESWILGPHDTIDFKATDSMQQKSYLFSNWLQKDVDGYKLRFKISSESLDSLKLNVFLFNDQMEPSFLQEIKQVVADPVVIPIENMNTYFRVAFVVENKSDSKESAAQFTLESIDLGDPCVNDETVYNTCTGRGECIRIGVDDYKCECDPGFFSKDCEEIDYCEYNDTITNPTNSSDISQNMTGTEFCSQIPDTTGCENGGYSNFSCICIGDKFWNFNTLRCQKNLKCPAKECDLESEKCKEPSDDSSDAVCECRKGFVNETASDGSKSCIKFDPCTKNPCNSIGKCESYGHSENDYICVCPEGFNTFKDKNKCEPIFCKFPTLNKCEQICDYNSNGTGYECSCEETFYELNGEHDCKFKENNTVACNCTGGSFCGSDENDCKCKKGYKLGDEEGVVKCIPDLEFDAEGVCPDGKVNNTNNELACDCGNNFLLNATTNTCYLKPICVVGGVGRDKCDSKNALCITQSTVGNYTCECPVGKMRNDSHSEQWECIDVCDFKSRKSLCSKIHATCNPIKLLDENNETLNEKEFCDCNPGYVWRKEGSNACVIAMFTAQFSLSIKNTFTEELDFNNESSPGSVDSDFYLDSNGYANELISKNEENSKLQNEFYQQTRNNSLYDFLIKELKPILELYKYVKDSDQIAIKDCQLNGNYYDCKVVVYLAKYFGDLGANANLSQKLGQICINTSDSSNDCFFLRIESEKFTKVFISDQKNFSLIVNKKELAKSSFEKYKNCEIGNTNCMEYKYTNCKENESSKTSLFSCVCNTKYFWGENPVKLPIEDSESDETCVEYTCIVKKLCEEECPKPEENGNCIQSLPYKDTNDYWIAPVSCSCQPQYILINTSNSISCTGVCVNVNCNHGKCLPKGSNGYACECDDGWSGSNCDEKFPLGGWISGIVVLAVLVIVASGVAFIYFRRARNPEFGAIATNNQQMNDYSPTSYRVGHSGHVVAHGQSAYHGNVNPAFSRD